MSKSGVLLSEIRYILILNSAVSFLLSLFMEKGENFILLSIVLLWLANLTYSLQNIKQRILFFFFLITFFVFLLGRPIIGQCRGEDWFHYASQYYYGGADTGTALFIILLSLLFIWLGAVAGNQYLLKRQRQKRNTGGAERIYHRMYCKAVGMIALIIFSISMTCTIAIGFEKIAFMADHTYADYYVSFYSQYPYIIYIISTFTEYSLCCYLATMPAKKGAFWALLFYVLSAVPSLIVGQRNPIVSNLIFAFIYYVLRDFYGSREKWVSVAEKTLMLICIPLGLVFLGLYNYIREGITNSFSGAGSVILDLFFKQGVTFSWFCSGLGVLDKLPSASGTNYTFGGILDYFRYGSIGRLVSGSSGLGQGNNILKATKGNSMAHHLSYVLMGNQYLEGHGCGSSFLLEVYADFRIFGIMIFCFALGFLLIYLVEFGRHGKFQFVLLLSSVPGFLFMPRAEAIGGISFLLRLPFWCTVSGCWIGGLLLTRRYFVSHTRTLRFRKKESVLYEYCSCDSRRQRASNESGYTKTVY